ncbi:hypothetical protein FFJ24_021580 [Pedobacter sp. KBS0701]|uniref:hypothetical protein n=1 Tax=Pedobacter sp. KBS0701 TaxID=2578106 RepID=UPI00110F684C|nr:hypothetical protein [Pedobacter sp. KBS0701]QDW27277.1 hypothetical protein FFJ24_021580 [Pedobacter sp. KBS0701]
MEELTGTIVAVHPDLTTDPVSRQGQIGMVVATDLKNDTISVGFGSPELGHYSSDALLVLKEKNQLYQDALLGHKELGPEVFKQMLVVNMIQDNRPDHKNMVQAMEIALSSEKMMQASTVSLESKLALDISQAQQQIQYASIGR